MGRYTLSIPLLLPPLPALGAGARGETGEPVQELEGITVSATRTERVVVTLNITTGMERSGRWKGTAWRGPK